MSARGPRDTAPGTAWVMASSLGGLVRPAPTDKPGGQLCAAACRQMDAVAGLGRGQAKKNRPMQGGLGNSGV